MVFGDFHCDLLEVTPFPQWKPAREIHGQFDALDRWTVLIALTHQAFLIP